MTNIHLLSGQMTSWRIDKQLHKSYIFKRNTLRDLTLRKTASITME